MVADSGSETDGYFDAGTTDIHISSPEAIRQTDSPVSVVNVPLRYFFDTRFNLFALPPDLSQSRNSDLFHVAIIRQQRFSQQKSRRGLSRNLDGEAITPHCTLSFVREA